MSGGKKKQGQQGQKHQNKTAFKIQFNPLALQIHKKVSFRGLCKRCAGQISWKLQYNKYKKMTEPSRCALCQQKNVLRTYMTACEPCSQSLRICPKCMDPQSEEQVEVRLTEKEQKKQEEDSERKMNEFLKTLKERSRRTVKRLYEKGTITWEQELNNFVDEEGNTLPLQFRQGFGANVGKEDGEEDEDIDEFGDEDDEQGQEEQAEEGQEEEEKKKKSKDTKAKKDKQVEDDDQEQQEVEQDDEQEGENEQDDDEQHQDDEEQEEDKPKQGQTVQEGDTIQNDQDWQDIDQQDQQQDDGHQEEQSNSESSHDQKKKKRKQSGHKHARNCRHK